MKNVIPAAFASVIALGIASAFAAQPMKAISTSDLSGSYTASVSIGLGGAKAQFKEVLTPHGATARIRVSSYALGYVDSSRLGNALQVMSVQAPTGICVSFNNETIHAGFDEYDFYVGVAKGVKAGTYPVSVNLHNPLSGNDGSVSFNVVVQ